MAGLWVISFLLHSFLCFSLKARIVFIISKDKDTATEVGTKEKSSTEKMPQQLPGKSSLLTGESHRTPEQAEATPHLGGTLTWKQRVILRTCNALDHCLG